mgnify:CR=1 FL=1
MREPVVPPVFGNLRLLAAVPVILGLAILMEGFSLTTAVRDLEDALRAPFDPAELALLKTTSRTLGDAQ